MKKNLSVFGLFTAILLALSVSSASADPTYAVLDANGNVTNVIVCGSACASGEFDGNKVVLQVASDPVTNENRGSFYYGPGTTKYDESSGIFTVIQPEVVEVISSLSENDENQSVITSKATISGNKTISFKYENTIGSNLFTKNAFIHSYTNNTESVVSVNKNEVTESLNLGNRKTVNEVTQIIENSNLVLLNSKIQTLINLLGSWIK